MEHINEVLKDRNIVLKGADALTKKGFTQVPNHILRNTDLSTGAKLAYTMLLSYAWQNDRCFPGQETLARDLGAGTRSVVRYIRELEEKDFIEVQKRGLGRPNLYILNITVSKKQNH